MALGAAYELVETPDLFQGDFLKDCPNFLVPPSWRPDAEIEVPTKIYPLVIVLSNTCDIVNDKVDNILVSPVDKVDTFFSREENSGIRLGDIQNKRIYRYCYLPACNEDGYVSEGYIVDFSKAFSLPSIFVKHYVSAEEKHLRTNNPYREDLSHTFGEYISRVSLPLS